MRYDPAADAAHGYALWVCVQRHRLLIAGAFPHDGERVDILVLWALR